MKQYDEIMSKIVVTEEMKMRILKNIQQSDVITKSWNKTIRYHAVKKYLSVAACVALLLAGVIAIPQFFLHNNDASPELMLPGSGIITVSSSEELADTVGFKVEEIEKLPFEVEERIYTSYGGNLGEITYIGENESVVFRKSIGDEDNSGDYTEYHKMINNRIAGNEIELRGNGELFYLAVWNMNGFSYSVGVRNGIDETAFTEIIDSVISE